MITDINSEDRLVQRTFAEYLEEKLGWESLYAWNQETFGLAGTTSFIRHTGLEIRFSCTSCQRCRLRLDGEKTMLVCDGE